MAAHQEQQPQENPWLSNFLHRAADELLATHQEIQQQFASGSNPFETALEALDSQFGRFSRKKFLQGTAVVGGVAGTMYVADRLGIGLSSVEAQAETPFSPIPEFTTISDDLRTQLTQSLTAELASRQTLDKPVSFPLNITDSNQVVGFTNSEGNSELGNFLTRLTNESVPYLSQNASMQLELSAHIEEGQILSVSPLLRFTQDFRQPDRGLWVARDSLLTFNEAGNLYRHIPIPGITGSRSSARRISDQDHPGFVANFQSRYAGTPPPPNRLFLMQEAPAVTQNRNRIVSMAGTGVGYIFIDGFTSTNQRIRVLPTAEPTATVIGTTGSGEQLVETAQDKEAMRIAINGTPAAEVTNLSAPIAYALGRAESPNNPIWWAVKRPDGNFGYTYSGVSPLNVVGAEVTPSVEVDHQQFTLTTDNPHLARELVGHQQFTLTTDNPDLAIVTINTEQMAQVQQILSRHPEYNSSSEITTEPMRLEIKHLASRQTPDIDRILWGDYSDPSNDRMLWLMAPEWVDGIRVYQLYVTNNWLQDAIEQTRPNQISILLSRAFIQMIAFRSGLFNMDRNDPDNSKTRCFNFFVYEGFRFDQPLFDLRFSE